MDAFFNFLFETRAGVAVLIVGGIILFMLIAYITERKTHKLYVDRGPKTDDEDDGWSGLFG